MNSKLSSLMFFLVVLAVGGALTVLFVQTGTPESLPGAHVQVGEAEASVFRAEPWQAQQFFFFVGFMLVNLAGIGVTIAVIMWLLNYYIANAAASANKSAPATTDKAES